MLDRKRRAWGVYGIRRSTRVSCQPMEKTLPTVPVTGPARQIYYEDSSPNGGQPVIVFSHGFLMDHTMFATQVAMLSPTWRCITWDQRGHGLTAAANDRLSPFDFYDSANDLSDLLDYLKIESAVLVGMSQGGFLSLRCALTNPNVVRSLILIDTEAGLMSPQAISANEGLLAAWLGDGFANANLGTIIATQIIGPGDGQQVWPGAGAWIAKWGLTRFHNLIPCFNALVERDDVTPYLGALHKRALAEAPRPALVIHGSLDASVPLAAGQAMAQGLGVECQVIDGAGHGACMSYFEVVNPIIQQFLADLPALPSKG
jgi:pimeloyl-ACP methyl ester carboxylesterase